MTRSICDPDALASFYHLQTEPAQGSACRGLACFAARADNTGRWKRACEQSPTIYCLGQCYAAPAEAGDDSTPAARVVTSSAVLLGNIVGGGVRDLNGYVASGGGEGLVQARGMGPSALIELVSQSGLRGRGGAGFSTGRKWAAVRAQVDQSATESVIVINADEGDPGAFSDKALLAGDPFRLMEGVAIAAHAIGANEAVIYLRGEYPDVRAIFSAALDGAKQAGWPGEITFSLEAGKGSYVCGEETSLLNALEGRRPFARSRPPYPFQRGLHGRPTLVHNVETLCALPWIVEHGAQAYRELGHGESAGTKLVSLNSLFRQPGLVEIPFGIRVRKIVEDIGGGLKRGNLLGLMIGGPITGLLPPSLLETPFTYRDLHSVGCAVGHGGVIAFANDTSIVKLIAEVFRFGATESCGLCVPCHLGTAELMSAFEQLVEGRAPLSRKRWDALIEVLELTSLCGHGSGLAEFARSIERHYPEELASCLQ